MAKINIGLEKWNYAFQELINHPEWGTDKIVALEADGVIELIAPQEVVDDINNIALKGKERVDKRQLDKAEKKGKKIAAGNKVLQKLGITNEEFFDLFGIEISDQV